MLTGKEVKIGKITCLQSSYNSVLIYILYTEFLDEVDHGEERAIEYLVRDEVGALASTLQVVSVSILFSCIDSII